MAISPEERELMKAKTAKPLLWVAMGSMVMLFGGLTSGYIVRKEEVDWLLIDLPVPFYLSTLLICLSSLAMFWATRSAKGGQLSNVKIGLGLTLVLGLGFVGSQFMAWQQLVDAGFYLSGSGVSASFLYVLTGLHLAHLAGGLIAVLVTFLNSLTEQYNAQRMRGIELCSIYWHFLGALWVYLLLFLLFIR